MVMYTSFQDAVKRILGLKVFFAIQEYPAACDYTHTHTLSLSHIHIYTNIHFGGILCAFYWLLQFNQL